ncbi:IS4 family transposase [Gallionella capsiferriformans]|uniref:Transposase IS4 family protein n=1 Tax=Gallionella capsiferriformans (strain ES-2) TaxID=395494 RepID=D9SCP4_GALCS|nr:IS4 family transposase [Gallionella capsiferriformans]ADL54368.1 transposase IS4 family protein [Gallionella capsiferriformans ES-2]ADL54695.1 transposase IS4 family protein [Gallionella capsiferriformans ES-2]ADL54951.1 transposase IS4 family protein [Gallionella capsiferriformans ES-2]ADL55685.1 transposase IS4 family protein [Gallionella capsiferriformans ES-2]ADL55817.1 transposase IS4 family protein [Gallionella capsiferriformans ES-2]
MNRGKTVFAQLLDFVPFNHFEYLTERFAANHGIKHFSAWSQFICMAYAQLTRRDGLRDLVACLNSQKSKLYHIGIRSKVSRSTLADANERRDWRLFEALGHRLISIALELYRDEDIGLGLKEPLYAMDSTTIDLCLTLFPWAEFRSTKAAVKAHTIIDLRGSIPVFLSITTGKVHDVNLLDVIPFPAGTIVVIDRGYLHFARLYALHQRQVTFVIRAKNNLRFTWIASREVDKATGLRCDQTILLATPKSKTAYPERLRRVSFRDPETGKHLVFLTNRFDLPALTIANIYKNRWQIELFFKWLKQNLAIKHFYGNSLNAVKSQIWIAICVYLLVSIAKKQLNLPASQQILLNLFEVNMFDKTPINQMVANAIQNLDEPDISKQLNLFDF